MKPKVHNRQPYVPHLAARRVARQPVLRLLGRPPLQQQPLGTPVYRLRLYPRLLAPLVNPHQRRVKRRNLKLAVPKRNHKPVVRPV